MPSENRKEIRRRQLIEPIAQAFAELGYRKATTKKLAEWCEVSEVIFYRLWDEKIEMFVASIDYLYRKRMEQWDAAIAAASSAEDRVEKLIIQTADSLGQGKLYRIIFVALTETDHPEVKAAMQRLYRDFHQRIQDELTRYHKESGKQGDLPEHETAWAVVGWGAFMNIVIELNLISGPQRLKLFRKIARSLLELKPE